ncbi:MAG TPA: indole-3-glycerol phosphate synthase TrpC [Fimbriimonadaceae bacterium]|nr:indole-3-glycerol phosphate synthase TrpC [Fimbriimonadaceae bacterium]HRJ97579.1 indole-3-glycerol phosphate synthase TrpC [Fimbriimonadaceae bacterium]
MSLLEEILATKRDEVAKLRPEEVRARLANAPPVRAFRHALESASVPVALIAEVKRASPSEGLIREPFDPAALARTYRDAGAQCLSVLTDRAYFQGSPEHLRLAREASGLPVLRKDFVVDALQIAEARAMGADAILLIAAALDDSQLRTFREEAESLGMVALVEVHTEAELDRALESGATLIGVNNRDLSSFKVDLGIGEVLLPRIGRNVLGVGESAIRSFDDVERLRRSGARAVLIGTTFCRAEDVGAKVREVMGW